MEPNTGEESGELYSPDEQGENVPEAGTLSFSVQGLSDALTALDTEVTEVQPPSDEFALQLRIPPRGSSPSCIPLECGHGPVCPQK